MSPDEDERQARTALHGGSNTPDVPGAPADVCGKRQAPVDVPNEQRARAMPADVSDERQAPTGVPNEQQARATPVDVPSEQQVRAAPADILNEHHRRNHAPRLPNEAALHAAAEKQLDHVHATDDDNSDEDDDEDDEDDEPCSSGRAKRKYKTSPDAKTLRYYTGSWKTALITVKKRFQGYIVLNNSFPSRENLDEASHILAQVIEEMKEDGTIFSNGKFLNHCWCLLTITTPEFSQDRNMNIVVSSESLSDMFENLSDPFRSSKKQRHIAEN